MPKISLYIDSDTLNIIEHCAKLENESISEWVNTKLKESLERSLYDNYTKPNNYTNLFGSINDDTFTEDAIKLSSKDVERESL